MQILEIAILACIMMIWIALLVSVLCYTRIRLAEIKARGRCNPEDGGVNVPQELAKPSPGSVEEGFENIMTYRTGDGDSL